MKLNLLFSFGKWLDIWKSSLIISWDLDSNLFMLVVLPSAYLVRKIPIAVKCIHWTQTFFCLGQSLTAPSLSFFFFSFSSTFYTIFFLPRLALIWLIQLLEWVEKRCLSFIYRVLGIETDNLLHITRKVVQLCLCSLWVHCLPCRLGKKSVPVLSLICCTGGWVITPVKVLSFQIEN